MNHEMDDIFKDSIPQQATFGCKSFYIQFLWYHLCLGWDFLLKKKKKKLCFYAFDFGYTSVYPISNSYLVWSPFIWLNPKKEMI